ncbi:arfaptin-2-like isoform 2-T2 [Menidia menidia]
MADSIMSKAATMEIPINSNGDTGTLTEDDSLEQDLQQVMVSGPNLNETSIVSGGYGGPAGGIIPTSSIKDIRMKSRGVNLPKSQSAASRLAHHTDQHPGSLNHNAGSSEEVSRGVAVEKLDSVKKWGINTYKCTKQMFSEKFGRGSRTVDLELEAQIDVLRDTKSKYESILRLATALITHFQNMVQTQQALGDTFTDLSQKSPELQVCWTEAPAPLPYQLSMSNGNVSLQDEFGYNAETQKLLCKNGEALLGAINFFVSSVNTLVNKTMEDTLLTIKLYENARLEFDAYRSDLEELSLGPRDAAATVRIEMAQQDYHVHREKYERLRSDVTIKLKFLEENKVKVMHKQLLLFHNAISAYFAGNQQQLEQTLIQFNVKLKPPGSDKPSWLEEQ